VLGRLATLVAEARAAEPVGEGFVLHRPSTDGITVVSEGPGVFRVVGRAAERAVALSDLTNLDALAWADSRLEKLGVRRALGRAGAIEGDEIRVGKHSFSYEPDR
jgi:GTP-binding protein